MESVTEAIPASSDANLSLLFLSGIDAHWQKYTQALTKAREALNPATVRGLRIASRRLRVLLQLMQWIQAEPSLQKPIRRLKQQALDLDILRDAQVMLDEVSSILPQMPELKDFDSCLAERECDLSSTVRKGLKDSRPAFTLKRIVRWIESLDPELTHDFLACLAASLDQAFQEVQARSAGVDPADPATIHSLRVAFRKFRYMLQAAAENLPGFPQENLERIKHFQALMGKVQDYNVLIKSLADFSASNPGFDPCRALDHYHLCLNDSISAFLAEKDALNSFWRASPGSPFPWEKNQ